MRGIDALDEDAVVQCVIEDGVAYIRLNRPSSRNAVSVEVANRLTDLWDSIERGDDVKAVVLDAAECGVFCAGMDLKEMKAIRESGEDPLAKMHDPFQSRMREIRKPIITALTGHFIGAGMLLAMGADIRIGLAGTTGAISEVKFGRGTSWIVPMLWMLPASTLAELAMTGDPVPVEDLKLHGFINHVEDTVAGVRQKAREIAEKIAANAPLSVQAAKQTIVAGMDLGCAEGLRRGEELHRPVYASRDATEGAAAFSEKRKPRWMGR